MTELQERDAMQCRRCGRNERASEGYPCVACGTFICLPCTLKGAVRCAECEAQNKPPRHASASLADNASLKANWPKP